MRACLENLAARCLRLLCCGILLAGSGAAAHADEEFVPQENMRVCAPERPAGGDVTPCKQVPTAAQAMALLEQAGGKASAHAIDGDVLTVVVRAAARDVPYPRGPYLCCELQAYLDKVSDDVYAASFRWNLMPQAMLDLILMGMENRPDARVWLSGASGFAMSGGKSVWDLAAPAGYRVVTERIDAGPLLGMRQVTIARGPACLAALAQCSVIYMPDGESAISFLGNALANGVDMRRFVIAGVHGDDVDAMSRRIGDLLFGMDQPRYYAFMRFVTEDLVRHVEGSDRPRQRIAAGYSNGGAWALDALVARPDLFLGAIIMSPAQWKFQDERPLPGHRAVVGAGYMEPKFQSSAVKIAAGLRERGAGVSEVYVPSGHSMNTWINVWNKAVREFDESGRSVGKQEGRSGADEQ